MYTVEQAGDKLERLRRLTSDQVSPLTPRQQQCTRVVHVTDAASSNRAVAATGKTHVKHSILLLIFQIHNCH